jgi:hypothetical protein
MEFVLTGFIADTGFRVFAFDGIAADRTRTPYVVRADLALIRAHGIMIQDLPLLCRVLLDRRDLESTERTVTFTEADMRAVAGVRDADRDAAQRKKALRRIPPRRPAAAAAAVATAGAR